ncbi:hypothetical protein HMPREF0539_2119 [Lacticaseibacillus rhamnosus LMS2-1]|uniref:Uncharacterized protein n=1 Tax=Lacticaseibacillus rhamnosus (strain LMS2-1) TaxID=525361 RepID=C2JYY4_LACRM|nr:hypothetical protein HMPREF0539_2119 [Lacticaseibacillus rhamnosus LMS2-1]
MQTFCDQLKISKNPPQKLPNLGSFFDAFIVLAPFLIKRQLLPKSFPVSSLNLN